MSRSTRIAAAALNQTALDLQGNTQRIVDVITVAEQQSIQFLCLPELCLTGYGCEDQFYSHDFSIAAEKALLEIAQKVNSIVVTIGLPLWIEGRVYNCVAVICQKQIRGIVPKQNLAGAGIHYEPRWFTAWRHGETTTYNINQQQIPFGDLLFEIDGVRFGFEICEDAWVADRPAKHFAGYNLDIILNPSASHFQFGKQEIRRQLVRDGSRISGAAYVLANHLGCEAGRAIYDGGNLIAQAGAIVAEADRFSYQDSIITTYDIVSDTKANCTAAKNLIVANNVLGNRTQPTANATKFVDRFASKEEEFAAAVSLGLFDYMRKSKSCGFVLSLSGGADSAAIACLVNIMWRRALADIGFVQLKKKLSYFLKLTQCESEKNLGEVFLSCVYQKTTNSSDITLNAAKKVAEQVGAHFHLWEISALVDQYEKMVGNSIGQELSWQHDNIARQNIQARVRSPGVWMLANLLGSLLLVTSNRSEASVGYATMDGDTSGGLAPIAGIDKAYLRTWLLWLEEQGPSDLGKFPALSHINIQAPTAELKPLAEKQTDEADLMPYVVLNEIERLIVGEKYGKQRTTDQILEKFVGQYTPSELNAWVAKFIRLWQQNQWKRERFAPSFHLDQYNVDPKSWCRFPILSAPIGF